MSTFFTRYFHFGIPFKKKRHFKLHSFLRRMNFSEKYLVPDKSTIMLTLDRYEFLIQWWRCCCKWETSKTVIRFVAFKTLQKMMKHFNEIETLSAVEREKKIQNHNFDNNHNNNDSDSDSNEIIITSGFNDDDNNNNNNSENKP